VIFLRKIIFAVIILALQFANLSAKALEVSATSAVLIDAKTGQVLYEKNAYERRGMASTTKIMTAICALENANLSDTVTVSKKAAYQEGSSIYLLEGEKIKMEDLLYGLMLNSGNDAAVAIAEHVSGSVEEFAKLMTKKAEEIGAKNTQFKNPSGLDEEGHYTTAYDLALISRYALSNPDFKTIVSTKRKTIPNHMTGIDRYLKNHNKMLFNYEGATGIKTGFTKKTGRCLVTSAQKDGQELIAVTLNAPDDWRDHTNMLNYGFSVCKKVNVLKKDDLAGFARAIGGTEKKIEAYIKEDLDIFLKDGVLDKVKVEYKINDLPAPVAYGDSAGEAIVLYNDEIIERVPLYVKENVEKTIIYTFWDNLKKVLGYYFVKI